jgi:hypothetical protein
MQGPADQQLRGNFTIVKLHGPLNWQTASPQSAMVVGTAKTKQIAASPLLAWYLDVFKSVLPTGDVRLLAIGYGFGDEHVNAAIADATKSDDYSVLALSSERCWRSPFSSTCSLITS